MVIRVWVRKTRYVNFFFFLINALKYWNYFITKQISITVMILQNGDQIIDIENTHLWLCVLIYYKTARKTKILYQIYNHHIIRKVMATAAVVTRTKHNLYVNHHIPSYVTNLLHHISFWESCVKKVMQLENVIFCFFKIFIHYSGVQN